MIWTLTQVALGGAIGASARFLTNLGALRLIGPGFPWATITVNILGSFLMGLLWVTLDVKGALRLSPLLLTGVLGGFTTFSAFSLDAITMVERGEIGLAAAYIVGSVVLSLLALMAGLMFSRGMFA